MSEGRWVWCPPGWRVVPEEMTEDMEAAFWGYTGKGAWENLDWRRAVAAAPKPPSGWRQWQESEEQQVLRYYHRRSPPSMEVGSVPYDDTWWTPLPPPQEVRGNAVELDIRMVEP